MWVAVWACERPVPAREDRDSICLAAVQTAVRSDRLQGLHSPSAGSYTSRMAG